MRSPLNTKGFGLLGALVIVLVVAIAGFSGWLIWNKNHDTKKATDSGSNHSNKNDDIDNGTDETADWTTVTTQGKAFSMKVPDGWKLTSYPGDFLGSTSVTYRAGTPAEVTTSSTEYVGDSLRFRASVSEVTDTALGPQWSSPQTGLAESTEDFSAGSLQGKRYKAVFSADLHQTIYEYVFSLGGGKKLDIVYTIYHDQGEIDDVVTVEKAIKSLTYNQ